MLTCLNESRQTRRKKERSKAKFEAAQQVAEKETFKEINFMLRKVYSEDELKKLAKKMNVIQRNRKLTPYPFVSIIMIGCVCDTDDAGMRSLRRMCLLLRKYYGEGINITPQALQQKINRKEVSILIKEIMSKILGYKIDKSLKKFRNRKSKIIDFYRILLQDSTVISLPPSLKRIFRGCGGAASEAAVKCDFIIDQSNNLVIRVKFVAGRVPDSTMSSDIVGYLEKNDLVIRDLGYFNLSQLSKITNKKAYFISRLSKTTNIYLNQNDKEPLDLIAHLKKLEIEKNNVDIDVYIGRTERLQVRLIGIKVPQEVVEARRQKYKENHKKKEPTEELQEWNGYTLMISNISKKTMSIKMILKIYKIRWQIELFFKNMKSNLGVDNITGENKYRILCIVYIKITFTWIIANLYAYAQGLVAPEEEVSLDQFTKWLKEENRLKYAFITGDLTNLLDELKRDVDLLCKQKRKRKTTWRDIEDTYVEENGNMNAA
jgi:hypothetical protein